MGVLEFFLKLGKFLTWRVIPGPVQWLKKHVIAVVPKFLFFFSKLSG